MNTPATETFPENETSDPHKLRSMEFVTDSLRTEVKEFKQRRRQARIRSLTDITLMLLTMLVTILVATYIL